MICGNCGVEIPASSASCPYCENSMDPTYGAGGHCHYTVFKFSKPTFLQPATNQGLLKRAAIGLARIIGFALLLAALFAFAIAAIVLVGNLVVL